MNRKVATTQQTEMVTSPDAQALSALTQSIATGQLQADQLEKVLDAQERILDRQARMDFTNAMKAFKEESIVILKDKQVSFGQTSYAHASLANIIERVVPFLSKHGLSHRWETFQNDGSVTVRCILTHVNGHSEDTSMMAPADSSGQKNSIQAIASTVTYLERYTFLAATGLAVRDQMEDDGASFNQQTISEKQIETLDSLITEVGADKAKFLKMCKVENLEDLPTSMYHGAVERLEAKRS